MSQGLVIDIMTYNFYSLQYYSFGKEKTMRLDLTNHTSTKTGPKNIKTNIKDDMGMTRGQVFVTPRESLTKIPYQNALEFLASWEDLIGDRLRLEFLE